MCSQIRNIHSDIVPEPQTGISLKVEESCLDLGNLVIVLGIWLVDVGDVGGWSVEIVQSNLPPQSSSATAIVEFAQLAQRFLYQSQTTNHIYTTHVFLSAQSAAALLKVFGFANLVVEVYAPQIQNMNPSGNGGHATYPLSEA